MNVRKKQRFVVATLLLLGCLSYWWQQDVGRWMEPVWFSSAPRRVSRNDNNNNDNIVVTTKTTKANTKITTTTTTTTTTASTAASTLAPTITSSSTSIRDDKTIPPKSSSSPETESPAFINSTMTTSTTTKTASNGKALEENNTPSRGEAKTVVVHNTNTSTATTKSHDDETMQETLPIATTPLTLTFGDLPGYTGWNRPSHSTAAWYSVTTPLTTTLFDDDDKDAWKVLTPFLPPGRVAVPYRFDFACHHVACAETFYRPLFDVRAYGPSVVPGFVTTDGSGTTTVFAVHFSFLDPGRYVIEVVLAYSHVPPMNTFPTSQQEPQYEGYLLPDFPLLVDVVVAPSTAAVAASRTSEQRLVDIGNSSTHHSLTKQAAPTNNIERRLRPCQSSDLLEASNTSALHRARWKVVTRTRGRGEVPLPDSFSFPGYQKGINSLGIQMSYEHLTCTLDPLPLLMQTLQRRVMSHARTSYYHFVFVGDSNMLMQHKLLESVMVTADRNKMRTTFVPTNGGLTARLSEIQKTLSQLFVGKDSNNDNNNDSNKTGTTKPVSVLLYNAGLHDIGKMCSQRWHAARREIVAAPDDDNFSCLAQYERDLTSLTATIRDLPFHFVVFETTTAGWPKWGNYGFSWPTTVAQVFPLDSHACAEFNDVARRVVREQDIPVMDAYWLTVARPDHREINATNAIGKKMVHAGVEVYDLLVRQWVSLVLHLALSTTEALH